MGTLMTRAWQKESLETLSEQTHAQNPKNIAQWLCKQRTRYQNSNKTLGACWCKLQQHKIAINVKTVHQTSMKKSLMKMLTCTWWIQLFFTCSKLVHSFVRNCKHASKINHTYPANNIIPRMSNSLASKSWPNNLYKNNKAESSDEK